MKAARALAYQVLVATGIPQLAHRRRYRNRLAIVMYHAVVREALPLYNWCFVTEALFRRQMAYLKRHFEVVPLAEISERLNGGDLAGPLAAVTFDDGYRNNFTCAFPVLRAQQVPATVYLATDFIDSDRTTWDAELYLAFVETEAAALQWDHTTYPLRTARLRARSFAGLRNKIKEQPHAKLLGDVCAIRERLGCRPRPTVPLDSPFRMLQSREIREMADSGLVSFGGHTCGHCILRPLSPEDQRREIEQSLAEVRRVTGRACRDFAYPNGRRQDFDGVAMEILKEAGVERAVTTVEGPNAAGTPVHAFNRYRIGGAMNLAGFQLKVHHALAWLGKEGHRT